MSLAMWRACRSVRGFFFFEKSAEKLSDELEFTTALSCSNRFNVPPAKNSRAMNRWGDSPAARMSTMFLCERRTSMPCSMFSSCKDSLQLAFFCFSTFTATSSFVDNEKEQTGICKERC